MLIPLSPEEKLVPLGPLALTTTLALLYTVPEGLQSEIVSVRLINTTAASITGQLQVVRRGLTAGTDKIVVPDFTILGNDFPQFDLFEVLGVGDALWGKASATGMNLTAKLLTRYTGLR